jgi:hypothetical protein
MLPPPPSLLLLLLLLLLHFASGAIPVRDVKTFSSVLKSALVADPHREILCYDLNSTGYVTHLWFTVGNDITATLRM